MLRYRLSDAARADVIDILAWTHEQFGEAAGLRYASLIVAALRGVAASPDRPGSIARRETRRRRSFVALAPEPESRRHTGRGRTPAAPLPGLPR